MKSSMALSAEGGEIDQLLKNTYLRSGLQAENGDSSHDHNFSPSFNYDVDCLEAIDRMVRTLLVEPGVRNVAAIVMTSDAWNQRASAVWYLSDEDLGWAITCRQGMTAMRRARWMTARSKSAANHHQCGFVAAVDFRNLRYSVVQPPFLN